MASVYPAGRVLRALYLAHACLSIISVRMLLKFSKVPTPAKDRAVVINILSKSHGHGVDTTKLCLHFRMMCMVCGFICMQVRRAGNWVYRSSLPGPHKHRLENHPGIARWLSRSSKWRDTVCGSCFVHAVWGQQTQGGPIKDPTLATIG